MDELISDYNNYVYEFNLNKNQEQMQWSLGEKLEV